MSTEIDIDSWGKKPASAKSSATPSATSATSATPSDASDNPVDASVQKTKRKAKPEAQILTSRVLADFIRDSNLKMEGEAYFKAWITRTYKRNGKRKKGAARTVVLDFLIEVFRDLIKKGFV